MFLEYGGSGSVKNAGGRYVYAMGLLAQKSMFKNVKEGKVNMSEGWAECEGKCKHWWYCDWKFECGDCKTCPAYPEYCSGIGEDRCYLSKQNE